MRLGEQWEEIRASLPLDWGTARVALEADDEGCDHVARVVGSVAPDRVGNRFELELVREGDRVGTTPSALQSLLGRLDRDGVRGRLELVAAERESIATEWDLLVRRLPPDWSHLYAELELDSSDFLERGAILLSPTNPLLVGDPAVLRFRCARRLGYGVSSEMARRCLERLDAERITGRVRLLRVVSEDRPVLTQGPVWREHGRSV